VDIAFIVFFSVELILRVVAFKKEFFCGEDFRWNIFDFVLILQSVVDAFSPQTSNLSFLRIFRVFRLVRVVRVVRTVKALRCLRTMVFAMLNSFLCLMWAFVIILIITFVFGIIFANAVSAHFDNIHDAAGSQAVAVTDVADAERIQENFGSLYETMISLFAAITGGNDWMGYAELLRLLDHGEFYLLVFIFYIGFCLVGMLSVVTGIFVDEAVCTRTDDEVVDNYNEDLKRTSEEVKRIFKDADLDGSGTLSAEEFRGRLENPWVKAYFAGLDIDPSDAIIIFTLMDTTGNQQVSIDEFIDGTMKLKGGARSLDVLSMMFDSVRSSVKFNMLCSYIEDELLEMRREINPKAQPRRKLFKSTQEALRNIDFFSRTRTQKLA